MGDHGFFPLSRKHALVLLSYVVLAVIFFLPWARQHSVYGVSLFGWLMGLFMFVAPIVNLVVISRDEKTR